MDIQKNDKKSTGSAETEAELKAPAAGETAIAAQETPTTVGAAKGSAAGKEASAAASAAKEQADVGPTAEPKAPAAGAAEKLQGRKRSRFIFVYAGLAAALVLLLAANVCIGSVNVPLAEIPGILTGNAATDVNAQIVLSIRFPRALGALILGGALALSGYLLQTFFHNPIAGPYILGISSGAKLMVALAMVYFLGKAMRVSSLILILAAFLGAMIATGFVLFMSRLIDSMAMLIVSGVMIGYICSAVTDFVVTFADDSDIVNLHNWSQGSFSGISWGNVAVMAVVVFAASAVVFLLSKPLSAYQMGEAYAQNMGLNIRAFRAALIALSSILSAAVTAFAGPVSFVGMAVPQLMRSLLNTAKPILLIPACFLGGSVFCLLCDLLARTLFAPTELSISTMTAVFGAPVVIWVMVRKNGK